MNKTIRAAVKQVITEQDKTQAELAETIGVSRQYVSHMLRGERGDVPASWQKMLDELGLELTVQPKRSASGLPYSGDEETDAVLDDPELTDRLLAHRREFDASSGQTKEKLEQMLEEGELIPLERVLAELA